MNDILNNLIETCEWRNDTIGVPVCTAEIAPCEKIIESGKCHIASQISTSIDHYADGRYDLRIGLIGCCRGF